MKQLELWSLWNLEDMHFCIKKILIEGGLHWLSNNIPLTHSTIDDVTNVYLQQMQGIGLSIHLNWTTALLWLTTGPLLNMLGVLKAHALIKHRVAATQFAKSRYAHSASPIDHPALKMLWLQPWLHDACANCQAKEQWILVWCVRMHCRAQRHMSYHL